MMLDNNHQPEQFPSLENKVISDFSLKLPQLETIIEANPPTVAPEMLVIDVLAQINRHSSKSQIYSYVLITDELRQLRGILTERDIVRLTATQQDLAAITVREVMSSKVVTLKKSALSDISTALNILNQHQIQHLPIVSDRNQIEGIISLNSIYQAIHPCNLLKFRLVVEVMNTKVLRAEAATTILELSRLMWSNYQSYVVITQTEACQQQPIPIGIVTERDIIKLQLQRLDIACIEAGEVMSQPLECVSSSDPLLLVQQKMNQLGVDRLVVVGEQGEVQGVVTQVDMLRAIDTEELCKVIATLQQQLQQQTQKIRQANQNLQREILQRKAIEAQLKQEKELAQITLRSIGYGVITTNLADEIEELNPVAEQLIGWQFEEIKGKPLSSVIQVIEETTRNSIPSPLMRVMAGSQTSSSLVRSVLIARDGTEYAIRDSVSPIRDHTQAIVGVVWIFHDVTESRRLTDRLSWEASHDTLTGLYNRRKFTEKLAQAIFIAQKESVQHALCYCDLDKFKVVNDTCGHGAGDVLLRQITELLGHRVRSVDTLARLGGDEFGLLLYQCPIKQAIAVAQILLQTLADFRFTWEGQVFTIGISIGIVAIDASVKDLEQIMNIADAACYTAKAQGTNCIHVAH